MRISAVQEALPAGPSLLLELYLRILYQGAYRDQDCVRQQLIALDPLVVR